MGIETENYVYKKTVDWSLFNYGFAIPMEYQVIFGQITDRFLPRGEKRPIHFWMNGKSYDAELINQSIAEKFGNHADKVQVRYSGNSELAVALRGIFARSYQYIQTVKAARPEAERRNPVKLSEDYLEYLAVYTTEDEDTYLLEPIVAEDIQALHTVVKNQNERAFEAEFDGNDVTWNIEMQDRGAGLRQVERLVKIRKLNRKIGENLKLLYGYRCQICGRLIGEEYGSHVVEAHHIDYFVKSLNNDANNQIIVCPNHHSIIHDVNPAFDRKRLVYRYENGFAEKVVLNKHLQ